jgi:hypothetical protein
MSMNLAILDGPDFPIQTPTRVTREAMALGDNVKGDAMAKDAAALRHALEYALSFCDGDDQWADDTRAKFDAVTALLARRAPYSKRQIEVE